MNILQAKNEIKNTVQAYLSKNSFGEYEIESKNQRPLLLIGPPGIGKTQIMEQISKECQIGLVSYTITHHTRQSAVGLPFIQEKEFQGKTYSITEYTMSEIIASVYSKMEETGLKKEFYLLMKSIVYRKHWLLQCFNFYRIKPLEIRRSQVDGSLWLLEIRVNIINQFVILML